jgi:hypothetical protein
MVIARPPDGYTSVMFSSKDISGSLSYGFSVDRRLFLAGIDSSNVRSVYDLSSFNLDKS